MCTGIWSSVVSHFSDILISCANVMMLHSHLTPHGNTTVRAPFLMADSSVSCQIWKSAMSDPERRRCRSRLPLGIPEHKSTLKHSRDRQTARPGCKSPSHLNRHDIAAGSWWICVRAFTPLHWKFTTTLSSACFACKAALFFCLQSTADM